MLIWHRVLRKFVLTAAIAELRLTKAEFYEAACSVASNGGHTSHFKVNAGAKALKANGELRRESPLREVRFSVEVERGGHFCDASDGFDSTGNRAGIYRLHTFSRRKDRRLAKYRKGPFYGYSTSILPRERLRSLSFGAALCTFFAGA